MPKKERKDIFIGGETPEKKRKADELLRKPFTTPAFDDYLKKLDQDPLADTCSLGCDIDCKHTHLWTGSGKIINFKILNKTRVSVPELEIIGEDFDFEESACIDSVGLTLDDIIVKGFETDEQVFYVTKVSSKPGLPEIKAKHIYVLPE